MKQNIDYLKHCSLFSELNTDQLAMIATLVRDRHYHKDNFVFLEGDPGEALFILKDGLIKLTKRTEDGREHILHFIHPGEVFAEVVLFDGGDYPASAEVQQDSVVGSVRNGDMEKLISANPEIAISMLGIMARRLRIAQDKAMNLALNDVRRRLIFILLEFASQHGIIKKEEIVIKISLTNQELANMVGTTRETANRILGDLKKANVLEINRQQIIIKDRQKLRDLL